MDDGGELAKCAVHQQQSPADSEKELTRTAAGESVGHGVEIQREGRPSCRAPKEAWVEAEDEKGHVLLEERGLAATVAEVSSLY
eukprot:65271-Rhodomonas_salina.2